MSSWPAFERSIMYTLSVSHCVTRDFETRPHSALKSFQAQHHRTASPSALSPHPAQKDLRTPVSHHPLQRFLIRALVVTVLEFVNLKVFTQKLDQNPSSKLHKCDFEIVLVAVCGPLEMYHALLGYLVTKYGFNIG